METRVIEKFISEMILSDIERLKHSFIDDAIKEWDARDGRTWDMVQCASYPQFLRVAVSLRFMEHLRWN